MKLFSRIRRKIRSTLECTEQQVGPARADKLGAVMWTSIGRQDRVISSTPVTKDAIPMALRRERDSSSCDGHLLSLQPVEVIAKPGLHMPHTGPSLFRRQILFAPHAPWGHLKTSAGPEKYWPERRCDSCASAFRAHCNPIEGTSMHCIFFCLLAVGSKESADNMAHTRPGSVHFASFITSYPSTTCSRNIQYPG